MKGVVVSGITYQREMQMHGPIFIPRHLWHGCYNYTNEPAILIYHITNKYDGDDEDRLDPFIAGWSYERQVK